MSTGAQIHIRQQTHLLQSLFLRDFDPGPQTDLQGNGPNIHTQGFPTRVLLGASLLVLSPAGSTGGFAHSCPVVIALSARYRSRVVVVKASHIKVERPLVERAVGIWRSVRRKSKYLPSNAGVGSYSLPSTSSARTPRMVSRSISVARMTTGLTSQR